MGLLEQLQEQGWYLTQPGLEKLLEGDKNGSTPDVKQVVKLALNTDLREYGGGALASLTSRGTKVESFEGTGVVQLVKLRNLGAPKVNEESKTAPRLLKLTITDGQTQYVALEHEPIPALSLNTPPGTKILLKNGPIRITQGVMMLSDKNVTVLGGQVTALVEKWELSRTMAKYAKGGRLQFSNSGPPPWIPFGQKIQQPTAVNSDKDFKSLTTKEKEESKENSEFNALRNDAIAEATKLGTKKTFGGGAKQMVDANVQKIMDKGFTEDQAAHALKLTRNNVERALSNLQRIEGRKQQTHSDVTSGGPPSGKPDGVRAGGKRGFSKREDELDQQAKPSGKVSLFDYFGDILQDSEPAAGNAGSGGKKTSKESTPNDKPNVSQRGRSDSTSRSEGNRPTNNGRNQSSGTTNHSSSGGAMRNHSDNLHYAGGGGATTNGGGAKGYNQRFENNISSSFANRNTSSTSSVRDRGGRDQGGHYSGQREQQSNYKQGDYYGSTGNSNSSGRYNRGANENHSSTNHTGGAPASARSGGGSSRGNDSKYNQNQSSSTSGYGNSQQRSERSDRYHSNANSNTTDTGGGNSSTNTSVNNNASGGGKYGGGSGKGQSGNSANYGHSYGSEGRNNQQQSYGNDGRGQAGGGGGGGSSGKGGGASATQQQQQSSFGNGPKQSNYNQQGTPATPYGGNANTTTTSNSQGHYGQQTSGNSYGSSGTNNPSKSSNKNSRYGGKDESHKYSDASAPTNATPSGPAHNKKPSSKGHGSQTQPQSNTGTEHRSNQHQQSSYGPPSSGGGKHAAQQVSNANSGKVNQLTDQLGGMHISGSKSSGTVASSNTTNKSGPMKQMVSNHPPTMVQQHQPQQTQHVPQVASSPPGTMPSSSSTGPGGPSPGAPTTPSVGVAVTGPGVPKNFIQLPNGYNYNPYQIMGFQNKQTNEFALNVLKSQQQFDPMAQPTHLGAPATGPATVSPVGPGVGVPMAATGAPTGVMPPPTAVLTGGPTPVAVATPGPLTMAPTLAPATMAVQYPNWKIGDRCLAKYWEDGGFYTAEITDTSKNTFVVHFLEYGNYEEVLKTDCIPINQPGNPGAPPTPMTLSYHPAPTMQPPPPQPAPVATGPPVQYAPHPAHPHHPPHPHVSHHHGHVPPHNPPPTMAPAPGAYANASMSEVPPPSHPYAPFKPGPPPPQMAQPMSAPVGQPMNQYPTAQLLHIHPQQQQQPHQHHQQQQPQPPGAHMAQHHHHQHHQQMQPQPPQHHGQQQQRSSGGKFREQRPMYVPPAQRK
ncbi:trithorax group protein osa [Anopheles ziemanni]|uniref:trithorax group protein osa n=1 Tax=Anopheles coustani TaxID=139045 RepID=UPI0026594D43|nr:trithorax group protein osa [Anopheles coustani]XP_058168803.1 trithorax group protein osa [Anopheles ziemanni]